MGMTQALAPHLPYLRRYARALTGSQSGGDAYVRATLTAILSGKDAFDDTLPPRVALYALFHKIWASTAHFDDAVREAVPAPTPEARLQSLPSTRRAALLLTAVEGFSLEEAGTILGDAPDSIEHEIIDAQRAIESELESKVLIIEDEPIIALDLESLVRDLGHEEIGRAHV